MKVCFVVAELGEADARLVPSLAPWPAAELLARRGWEVHLLSCGEAEAADLAALGEAGVVVHRLGELPPRSTESVPRFGGDDWALVLGEEALETLELLQDEHRFDLIEFGSAALAMRPVQAKRLGNALLEAPLAVNLGAPAFWRRSQQLLDRGSPRELKLDYCERYAFEHADLQLAAAGDLLERARAEEWAVRDDAAILSALPSAPALTPAAAITAIALIGPLAGDGLTLFLAALDDVDSGLPIVFVGEDELVGDVPASELIAAQFGERPHRIEPSAEAAALLESGETLVVYAGTADPAGRAVAAAALGGVPFLAARKGAVPELSERAPGLEPALFEPTPGALAAALAERLALAPEVERELREGVAAAIDRESWEQAVADRYTELAGRPAPSRPSRIEEVESVSVVIAYYNHDRYLPGALASLAAQTRPPEEVIVIDDGSTSEAALRVFAEQEARYPQWMFVRQQNAGPGVARNNGLERASGGYFLPFDSDNLAAPTLVEELERALRSNPSLAAVTCHNLSFVEDAEVAAGRFAFRYSPTGGPRVLACLENVYGDTCAMFRTEALRGVGGFEINRWSPTEDWETFVKMATAGLELDVLPRPLFYYRTDSGGRLQSLGTDRLTTLRLRAHLVEKFFVNATLDRNERRQLFECLQSFDHAITEGMASRLVEQRQWHDSEMAGLDAFREGQLAEQASALGAATEAERARADAAEAELASLRGMTLGESLRETARRARRRLSRPGRD